MKESVLVPFRPYLNVDIVYLFDRLSEATGLSRGRLLSAMLEESMTFKALLENEYAEDDKLRNIFICISSEKELCNNAEKKENYDDTNRSS